MESISAVGKEGMIMDKPVMSPDFTIDDIHRLREYNYEMTKQMNRQDKLDYYNNKGRTVLKKLEARKQLRKKSP